MALKGLITTAEAARKLGLAQSYVYYLIKHGRLKAVRVGARLLLVDAESVRKFKPRPRGRPPKKGKTKARRGRSKRGTGQRSGTRESTG